MRVLLALLLLAPLSLATDSPASSCRTDGIVEVTGGDASSTYYLDTYDAARRGVGLYAESNGIWNPKPAGVYRDAETSGDLQRGGASPYLPDDAETEVCDPFLAPDLTIL